MKILENGMCRIYKRCVEMFKIVYIWDLVFTDAQLHTIVYTWDISADQCRISLVYSKISLCSRVF